MKVKFNMVLLLFVCLPLQSLQAADLPEGYSHDEAMRIGEQMYREGILPSGKPMQALVMGRRVSVRTTTRTPLGRAVMKPCVVPVAVFTDSIAKGALASGVSSATVRVVSFR